MNEMLETVKQIETRPKGRKLMQVRLSIEEKEMLAKLAKAFETTESEVIRRLIKASYDTLHTP